MGFRSFYVFIYWTSFKFRLTVAFETLWRGKWIIKKFYMCFIKPKTKQIHKKVVGRTDLQVQSDTCNRLQHPLIQWQSLLWAPFGQTLYHINLILSKWYHHISFYGFSTFSCDQIISPLVVEHPKWLCAGPPYNKQNIIVYDTHCW